MIQKHYQCIFFHNVADFVQSLKSFEVSEGRYIGSMVMKTEETLISLSLSLYSADSTTDANRKKEVKTGTFEQLTNFCVKQASFKLFIIVCLIVNKVLS